MTRGRLITFEGIDGCGKTTQLRLLERHLAERGVAFVSTREPGGTELGRKIRSALLDGEKDSVEPLAEMLLYAADRAQHVRQIVAPALEAGRIVLSDRFYDATTAYQGYARGFDLELVRNLNRLAAGEVAPDRTLLFDLEVEAALRRTHRRAGEAESPDRLDREPIEFHTRVRNGYLAIARQEPDRFRILPADGTVEEVFARMMAALEDIIPV